MKRTTNAGWTENRHALACPHCRAGADGMTVGLYWDFDDGCWQCIICGYREYERLPHGVRPNAAERIWDDCFDALDKEENGQTAHYR
jgi:hypothetical protein